MSLKINKSNIEEVCTPFLVQSWLRQQDPEHIFYMLQATKCVLGEYMRSISGKDVKVAGGDYWASNGDIISMPSWAKLYEKELVDLVFRSRPYSVSSMNPTVALHLLEAYCIGE